MREQKTVLPGIITECLVEKGIETGYVLRKEGMKILIHKDETKGTIKRGEPITVFLYENKAGDMEATMKIPEITMDQYGWAEVTHVHPRAGVFVHIGLKKDVLVSKDELPEERSLWPHAKDMLYVILSHDRHERLVAKPVREDTVQSERLSAPTSLKQQEVTGNVYRFLEESTLFVTDEGYRGFIQHELSPKPLRLGQTVTGRVIDIEEDGSIKLSLLPIVTERQSADADAIVTHLKKRKGKMPLTDQSPPDLIKSTLGLSKAAFKRAMGKLLKEKKVKQEDGFTFLIDEEE
ncbi:S1-like domain-containing RNA-binding protein [Salisediminibacterium selenitireducens]|uniref:S1 motif domain-containing protein n=1 Tax=Bacillus selenitireducens (strain ATCC 700615 / DSM 15326 / MLS10) TaxID=439292 RepID=D6XUF1_BACIE|nr:S1-like domain-containing RNA-binding protein [Salisediminibacterium selenitireducens]ADH99437.1 conserved hypothetical protein [[Bacillus] selenitireducens MLS10]